ncbi:choice-of-anchor L domain-containing protein [Ancylomarina euxinus]|nr:choice-of-anchor L domain-containing protein [Ancylomarina euxinus]MCZ4694443.1 choice-of-anchor L domain-containing protein [Ancylomarina euxinus]
MNNFYIKPFLLTLLFVLINSVVFAQKTYRMGDPSPIVYVQTGEVFYDSGLSRDYSGGESSIIVFESSPGTKIKVIFEEFEVEDLEWINPQRGKGYWADTDYLIAYDGGEISSRQIGKYYGTTGKGRVNRPNVITSSGSSITFSFSSDSYSVESGWKARFEIVSDSDPCITSVGGLTIWAENFEGVNQGWSADSPISIITRSLNKILAGTNVSGSRKWVTDKIDISNYHDLKCSIDIGSWGNKLDNTDYLAIYYSVDGRGDVEFSVNGNQNNDISAQTACSNIPEGDELTIKVVMSNDQTTEHYYVDNIVVSGESNIIGNSPNATCRDITVKLDNSGNANITTADLNNGSNDIETAEADLILSLDKSIFTCDDIGFQMVTFTVEDKDGNVSTCKSTVTIEDKCSPSLFNLTAEYYQGMDFQNLIYSESVTKINSSWGTGSPNTALLGNDYFSIRYSGDFVVPKTGDYTFYTTSDDGVRLIIDGSNVINNWTNHAPTSNSGTVNLNKGLHTITLEYYENTGGAVVELEWATSEIARQVFSESSIINNTIVEVAVELNASGEAILDATTLDPGYIDACGINTRMLNKANFSYDDLGDNTVVLTIEDNNGNTATHEVKVTVKEMPKLTFSPVPSTIEEGVGTAVIKASLNKISSKEISFEWCTEDLTAIKGSDYNGVGWTKVTIPAGELSVDLQVTIIDDDIHEADEEFTVFNTKVVNAISGVDRINCIIIDNDKPLPILSISDISVEEGVGSAIFEARLNKISSNSVSFRWSTSDWTARQPRDYSRKPWTNVTIPAGQLSVDLPVTINDDDEHESDEKFTCYLSNVNNAVLPKDNAVCTIVDNENSASIEVDLKSPQNVFTANQLVQDVLVTGCLTASNVNYSGDEEFGIGYFEAGNSDFPLKSGIILSTGEVLQAIGPNKGGNASNTIDGSSWDSDVFRLAGNTAKDAQILEFDFVPAGDKLEFRYIFASEEYPEFVGQGYNDVFGFILSGPDIKDVFQNDGMNIALIPGTNMIVSIDNVNVSKNSQFYVNGEDGFATRFDGFTTVLTASAKVTPCQTYHIRLIISDVFDSRINSAVFLEANSFKSNEVRVDNMIGEIVGDLDVMYEGCDGSFMRFTRNEDYDIDEEISFDIDVSGTASNQVDASPDYIYTDGSGKMIGDGSFPSSILIPAGEAYVDYHYKALDDSEIEGDETIIFRIDKCPCDGSEYYEKTVKIINSPKVDGVASAAIQCVGGGNPIATLTVQLANGMDSKNYLYSFDGGLTFDANNVKSIVGTSPDGSDLVGKSFSIVVKDLFSCGDNTLNMLTTIPNISPVTSDAGGDRKMCKGVGIQLMGKPGPFCEWSCSSPEIMKHLSNKNISNPWVADDIPGGSYEFTLRVQDKPGDNPICFEDSKMILTVLESPIIESVTAGSYSLCSEVSTVLDAIVTNMAVTYSWNPSVGLNDANISNPVFSADVLNHESRSYTLTVKSKSPGNECISVANLEQPINIYPNPTVSLNSTESHLCSNGLNGEIKVSASGGTPKLTNPLYDFSWNPAAVNSDHVTGLAPNLYTVTVIDDKGCRVSLETQVNPKPKPIGIFFE